GDAGPLVGDDRFKLLSFTGSQTVGWALKAKAGKKKVALELGGNAACVVDESADVDDAAERIVVGGYGYSGQSCISVQRVLVHESRYDELREAMVGRVSELAHGDTRDAETVVGPLIDEAAAARVEAWIEEARAGGASVLCGGTREATAGGARSLVRGAVLAGVAPDARLACDEVFGPVTVLERFGSFDEALERVNDSDFGLQAGVFTRDIGRSHAAWDRLRVGAVLINEIPSWRVDPMPYGGVKDSGLGREGPRYAIEEMTERRMMVVRG
ncbi:MAG: aldehyde dehydrogenase family protein, partial [Planctomycetota bacterium]